MKEKLMHCHKEVISELSHINQIVNVDEVSQFKSSPQQFWLILDSAENLVDVLTIANFYGNTKPNLLEEFLADFINEAQILKNDDLLITETKLLQY